MSKTNGNRKTEKDTLRKWTAKDFPPKKNLTEAEKELVAATKAAMDALAREIEKYGKPNF